MPGEVLEPQKTALDLLTAWLLDGGLQFRQAGMAGGGVSRGYSLTLREYEYAYTEITGYALSLFAELAEGAGRGDVGAKSQAALEYLLRVQALADGTPDEGAFCHSVNAENGEARRQFYAFDAAMCVQGLADHYRLNGDERALHAAGRACDWLMDRMQLADGSFRALRSAEDDADTANAAADPIFGDQGCLHAKHAMGLLKVWRVTGDPRYRAAAEKVCDWVIGLQNRDGSFRASPRSPQTASHTHCYAVEGLLYAGLCLENDRYLAAARRGGEWLARAQNHNGAVNIAYHRPIHTLGRRVTELIRPKNVGDASAQALRIWRLLDEAAAQSRYAQNREKAADFLCRLQTRRAEDPNAEGGIPYWPGHAMQFAWVGMFAQQAWRWQMDERGLSAGEMVERLF